MVSHKNTSRSSRREFITTTTAAAAASTLAARSGFAQEKPKPVVAIVKDKTQKVINGFKVDQAIVQKLVDKTVTTLAGVDDVATAWKSFVKPTEKVAVKFNGLFRNATTHAEVIKAVTQGLLKAGVKADNIIVYDRDSRALKTARLKENRSGSEPRIYGTGKNYGPEVAAGPVKTKLSNILLEADALINLPIMKTHCLAGMSGAMKNHLGTVNNAGAFHRDDKGKNSCLYVADLNALKPVREKTRLCLCDALYGQFSEGPGYSQRFRWDFYGIIASRDMVALDTVLAETIKAKRLENNLPPYLQPLRHLKRAVELGLGEGDLKKIKRIEAAV